MARKNSEVADQVASEMLGIMDSDEHKEIFGQTVSLEKLASAEGDDENEAKGLPPWLEPKGKKDEDESEKKDDDDKGEKKDDDKDEKKDEKKDDDKDEKKDDKEDKDDACDCGNPDCNCAADQNNDPYSPFPIGSARGCALSIQGLAKISEALDEAGFEKGAIATLKALEVLVAEAAVKGEANALGYNPEDLPKDIVAELVGEKTPKA